MAGLAAVQWLFVLVPSLMPPRKLTPPYIRFRKSMAPWLLSKDYYGTVKFDMRINAACERFSLSYLREVTADPSSWGKSGSNWMQRSMNMCAYVYRPMMVIVISLMVEELARYGHCAFRIQFRTYQDKHPLNCTLLHPDAFSFGRWRNLTWQAYCIVASGSHHR